MDIKVQTVKMTKPVIAQIIEVDKEFYADFDYSNTDWYYKRYSKNNEITVLVVDNKIVGYYLFYTVSKKLFDDICALKYFEDYSFPNSEINVDSDYYYIPSVLVKKEYQKYSIALLLHLKNSISKKDNIVAIAVSKSGQKMCQSFMKKIGKVKDNIYVYANIKNEN